MMKFPLKKIYNGKPLNFVYRVLIGLTGWLLLLILLNAFFPLPPLKDYSVIIRDDKGEMVHAFLTHDDKWRMRAETDEISPLLKKTLLAKEDNFFYYHYGVNPIAMGRAFFQNLLGGRRISGASTITMQVAKMLDPAPRTYSNKLKEMFRALQLEWYFSKTEILQLYCNLLPYGGNIEGIKSAALLYFGKDPDHLSLAEITALSIVPNRPSAWKISPNNPRLIAARNHWLQYFAEQGVFSGSAIKDALSEPLVGERMTVPRMIPHLARRLKTAGTDIQTNINRNKQLQTEELVKDYIRSMSLKNIRNAAVVIIDNTTNKVITYVGSADFSQTADGGQVDGVTAIRQPGSTLKPFLYGMCIDEGLFTPKSVIFDVPVNYEGYTPENYDRKFSGEVTLEYALEHSLNIPAVKALSLLGTRPFINALSRAGFRTIEKNKRGLGLSMALGGCGATLEELSGLFAAIARKGRYQKPAYTISDTMNRSFSLLSPAAAFMLTETLSKVNRPDFPLHWETTSHLPKIAWKTGTSYGRRDAWSIGYNQKYTVGVWCGNFSGASASDLSGAQIATPLLFRIFNAIDYNSQSAWYNVPDDCEIRTVCSETGMMPGDHCPDLISDFYVPLISSMKTCDNRKEFFVSPDEKRTYCQQCVPPSGFKKKWFKVIPPELQAYYEERKIAYDKIPAHNPNCEAVFKERGPVITAPSSGAVYYITEKDPEPLQLACQTGNDVLKVYWYINNKFYKTAAAGDKLYFSPTPGTTIISCTDDKGRTGKVKVTVELY